MRCAQRGCALPQDATTTEGALCPVCNNPLIVVMEIGDEEISAQNEAARAARLAADEAEAERLAAEVSQEKPADSIVLGEDGFPIPAGA